MPPTTPIERRFYLSKRVQFVLGKGDQVVVSRTRLEQDIVDRVNLEVAAQMLLRCIGNANAPMPEPPADATEEQLQQLRSALDAEMLRRRNEYINAANLLDSALLASMTGDRAPSSPGVPGPSPR